MTPRCRLCLGSTLPVKFRNVYSQPEPGRYVLWGIVPVCLKCSHEWSPGEVVLVA